MSVIRSMAHSFLLGYPDPVGWAAQVTCTIIMPHPLRTNACVSIGRFWGPLHANVGDGLMLIVRCHVMSLSSASKQWLFAATLVISFVFEALRVLVVGSRAGRARFLSVSA